MKSRQNWTLLIGFLVVVSLFLVACERPLPGGYNDPDAGSDQTAPDTLDSVPGVDPEAYPAGEVQPAESAPQDAEAYPAEAAGDQAAEEGGLDPEPAVDGAAADEEAAPEGDQPAAEEATEVDASSEEAPAEEAPADDTSPDAETSPPEGEDADLASTPGTHIIAAGENLYRIGLLYGINWLDLAEANGISDPADIAVGQVLTIPSADETAEETVEAETAESESTEEVVEEAQSTDEAGEEPEAAPEEAVQSGERPETYVVLQGDNLFRIGTELGVDWTEIVAANDIVGNQIVPGQVLIIPPLLESDSDDQVQDSAEDAAETADEAPAPVAEETTYLVQEGDTIYSVAFLHNLPWTDLISVNDIEPPYTLELGQTLIIPGAQAGE